MVNHKKHEIVFRYIVQYKLHYDGNSPSMREIAIGCDVSSTSLVWYYLQKLIDEGLIEMSEGTITAKIMVKGGVWSVCHESISR